MASPYNSVSSGIATRINRAAATLPQSGAAPIFTVSGGDVYVCQILGEVSGTAIGAGANNMKLIANPTVGADVDLCAVVDVDADAIGTMYTITGTLGEAMTASTSGAAPAQKDSILVAPGTIDLSCSASRTGQVKWTIYYVPTIAGAKVVAA